MTSHLYIKFIPILMTSHNFSSLKLYHLCTVYICVTVRTEVRFGETCGKTIFTRGRQLYAHKLSSASKKMLLEFPWILLWKFHKQLIRWKMRSNFRQNPIKAKNAQKFQVIWQKRLNKWEHQGILVQKPISFLRQNQIICQQWSLLLSSFLDWPFLEPTLQLQIPSNILNAKILILQLTSMTQPVTICDLMDSFTVTSRLGGANEVSILYFSDLLSLLLHFA